MGKVLHYVQPGNIIGAKGAKELSDALKINSSLTELVLKRDKKSSFFFGRNTI